ncbi:MAG: apolipoprotein N-acyltransferase [Gemmatimonadetes bacterium]|nr:apolipoprotein N-acyltransferase [Gemmatimonadota bacterium]MDE3260031.1 apolipoprotein N-acyltransferase [Gemmatimonadota bacterium]
MTEARQGTDWKLMVLFPAVSGLVLGAAFPPLPFGFLSYVALIPLLLSAQRLRGWAAFGAGFVQGIFFYGTTLYWIGSITPPGMAGAAIYMSLFRGLFLWTFARAVRRYGIAGTWSAPFLWVAFEYFNSLGDMGFPWVVLGNSQTAYLWLIQYAEVTGVYGVSFWIVLVNLSIMMLWRNRARRRVWAAALAVLFAGPAANGYLALKDDPDEQAVAVGLVQPDMPPVAKEYRGFEYNFGKLKPMTAEAAGQGANLVVWPETAVGYLKGELYRHHRERVQAMVDSLGIYLYTGAYRLEAGDPVKVFNSSFLFVPGKGISGYYDKTRLVPFGERAPFPELLPFLRKIRFTGGGFVGGNWDSGETRTVFDGPDARFSALICYDSVFPGFVRSFVDLGAEFLVIITNDGWFGRTSGPYQHAEAAVFRAIENRRDVVRCANTGVSTFIDAYGRKSGTTGIFHPAVLTQGVTPRTAKTFYTKHGDLFAQLCMVLGAILVLMAFRRHAADAEHSILPPGTDTSAERAPEPSPAADDRPMPFLDHLEELRWRLLKGLAALVVGAVICGIFGDTILGWLVLPVREATPVMKLLGVAPVEPPVKLIYLKPMGMFLVKLQIALVGGAVLALPVLLYQLWIFVAPGLLTTERRYVSFIVFSSSICFVLGGAIAYLSVVPLSFRFLILIGEGTGVDPQFDIGFYIGFVLRLLVAFGVVFELPVAAFFLSRIGLLTAQRMRRGRRYAVVIGFVLAALLTPPDPISQLMMALPLVLLYEFSIWVARVAGR